MYAFIPLALATVALALPHKLRDASTSTASATTPCAGAPAIPVGAVPGDPCDNGSSSTDASSSSASLPPSTSAAPARRSKNKGKRSGFSTCQTVTLDQYNTSPMKQAIEAMATTNWGGDFEVAVNPSDFPDNPLHFCYTSDPVDATFDNPPTCSTQQSNIAGNVVNGTADVTLSINQGITSTHAVTTEKSASIASSTEIGITLGVPAIDEASIKETVTITGTLTKGDTQTTALNQQTTETVVAHATKPGPCNIQLNVTSCTASASANVPAFYTGSVWFNYPDTRDGHFKWSLNIDAVLPADQRSDNVTLTDKITSQNNGQFTSECV